MSGGSRYKTVLDSCDQVTVVPVPLHVPELVGSAMGRLFSAKLWSCLSVDSVKQITHLQGPA